MKYSGTMWYSKWDALDEALELVLGLVTFNAAL